MSKVVFFSNRNRIVVSGIFFLLMTNSCFPCLPSAKPQFYSYSFYSFTLILKSQINHRTEFFSGIYLSNKSKHNARFMNHLLVADPHCTIRYMLFRNAAKSTMFTVYAGWYAKLFLSAETGLLEISPSEKISKGLYIQNRFTLRKVNLNTFLSYQVTNPLFRSDFYIPPSTYLNDRKKELIPVFHVGVVTRKITNKIKSENIFAGTFEYLVMSGIEFNYRNISVNVTHTLKLDGITNLKKGTGNLSGTIGYWI